MILASDNFNRANANPIGSPWTTASGEAAMQIVSNSATFVTNTDSGCYHSTIVWPNDQYSQAKLTISGTLGTQQGAVLKVRQAPAARTSYQLEVDHAATNNVFLDRIVAGVFTTLTGFPLTVAWTDGDTWELRALGTTISVYRNGVLVGSATDGNITSGSPGFGYSSTETSVSIDDWAGGDFSSGRQPLGRTSSYMGSRMGLR